MNKIIVVFALLMLCSAKKITAQNGEHAQAYIDSLVRELANVKDDTNKVKMLYIISSRYSNIDPEKGITYGLQGVALTEQLGWEKGASRAHNSVGVNYYTKSDYPNALDHWMKALKLNEKLGDKKRTAQVIMNIGNLYSDQRNDTKALEFYTKALKISEELNDGGLIAFTLGNLHTVYENQKNYPKALECLLKALKINEEMGNGNEIADNLMNIGYLYLQKGDFAQALEYNLKVQPMLDSLENKRLMAPNLGVIGKTYLGIAQDTTGVYLSGKNSLIPAGKAANLARAIDYFKKSLVILKEIGDLKSTLDISQELSTAYRLTGNYKAALEIFMQSVEAKDSVFSIDNNIKISHLETQRALDLKDKQIIIDKLEVAKKRNERGFFIAGIIAMLVILLMVFRNYKQVAREKQKSEELLLNILPVEVADELKEKGIADAKLFDSVTVLFTDFVNFTNAGERMTPKELVGELHECFKAFDEILSKYNVEKIKTIGDAYLAVSGLPVAVPLHAEHIVNAAIEILHFMQRRQEKMGDRTFGIRIGIHSGSVVAGIVGVKKFAYDIWGDTVNIAARMEQNSEPDRINISETTYQLVKNRFECTFRGELNAKNKGLLKMYFVEATVPELVASI